MTYETHRVGGFLTTMLGFELLRQHGMLLPDISPLLQLAIITPFSSWGSTASDLDHHWESVRDKNPVNWVVHKVLHLTRPHHRSWQTHSFFTLLVLFSGLMVIWNRADGLGGFNATDMKLLLLMSVGVTFGVLGHFIMDMLTPEGIIVYGKIKLRLVPSSGLFATGGNWEAIVRWALWTITGILALRFCYIEYLYKIF